MPEILSLRSVSAKLATFPMCAFNAPWQKYTTVMYSSGFDEWLDPLDRLTCTHTKHQRVAGGAVGENGTPSSETSAYPTDFNHYLARAVLSLARLVFEWCSGLYAKSMADLLSSFKGGG